MASVQLIDQYAHVHVCGSTVYLNCLQLHLKHHEPQSWPFPSSHFSGYFKTWTVDCGQDHGLDCGLWTGSSMHHPTTYKCTCMLARVYIHVHVIKRERVASYPGHCHVAWQKREGLGDTCNITCWMSWMHHKWSFQSIASKAVPIGPYFAVILDRVIGLTALFYFDSDQLLKWEPLPISSRQLFQLGLLHVRSLTHTSIKL